VIADLRVLPSDPIQVGGLVPLGTVDWPGQLAAVVFARGCPWRCGYCHNGALRDLCGSARPWAAVLDLLRARRGLLDGVVFSGGEPTLHPRLHEALADVRALGFATGLHTGGAFPERLGALLARGLLDWVGFDVKASRVRYDAVTGVPGSGAAAWRSLRLLVSSGVPCELRTTVSPNHHDLAGLVDLARDVALCGAGNLVLQPCRGPDRRAEPGAPELIAAAAGPVRRLLGPVEVRAA
jgi:pyruvate formate lyase activating enzyme